GWHQGDVADKAALQAAFDAARPTHVLHLAAQAGAPASIEQPVRTLRSNVIGTALVLDECRHRGVQHLVFASSSSVYGLDRDMPFSEHAGADHPTTPYGASKRATELLAHSYAHLFSLPCTGLRFFTVYGPWGRPDMAIWLFTEAILGGRPIDVFNFGRMRRDFTYIDDIVEGVIRTSDTLPVARPDAGDSTGSSPTAPWRLYNIGNNQPVELLRLIEVLEQTLGCRAEKRLLPMQPGDVEATWADIDDLQREVGFAPRTPIETGVQRFVDWYRHWKQPGVSGR
ncbi:MAG: NAD-dependent epimerase/dehydratase family protein, partial [Planctomycetaceae bacterium]